MQASETVLKGCFILEPRIFKDDRGYFFESFNRNTFEQAVGYPVNFVQDNQSYSQYGVVRGIHFQQGAYAQAKLVRVLEGAVLDVAVDLRKESPTYGQHIAVELSAENKKQLFVPRGFGHGFSVLSKTAVFAYKCDNFYHKASESGIIYNDPLLNIDCQLPEHSIKVSDKDLKMDNIQGII